MSEYGSVPVSAEDGTGRCSDCANSSRCHSGIRHFEDYHRARTSAGDPIHRDDLTAGRFQQLADGVVPIGVGAS